MTNATHSFQEWFAELKALTIKVGFDYDEGEGDMKRHYDAGLTPHDAFQSDLMELKEEIKDKLSKELP